MKVYPQLLKNVRVQDKEAVAANARLKAEVERVAAALGSDGRILLRPSGTEPKIRVMVEAKTNEICEKYVDEIIEVIKEEGLVLES